MYFYLYSAVLIYDFSYIHCSKPGINARWGTTKPWDRVLPCPDRTLVSCPAAVHLSPRHVLCTGCGRTHTPLPVCRYPPVAPRSSGLSMIFVRLFSSHNPNRIAQFTVSVTLSKPLSSIIHIQILLTYLHTFSYNIRYGGFVKRSKQFSFSDHFINSHKPAFSVDYVLTLWREIWC